MCFGEAVGVAGDVFSQLLQLAVLRYVTASLVTALGRLSYREAKARLPSKSSLSGR